MKFFMEVCVFKDGKMEWGRVKPSGKQAVPYSYDTFDEAERVLKMCYPLALWNEEIRVTYEGD